MVRKRHPRMLTFRNKLARTVWNLVWLLLYQPSPTLLHGWRRFLLRLFGARIGRPAYLYPSARIWAPWNLEMGDHSTLAHGVDCYCVDKVKLGSFTTVSQYSYLCTATHDYSDPSILERPQMPLLTAPIRLGDRVWITADVFVGPGVSIGDGTVVLARSSVTRDLPPWVIAAGSPAEPRKRRELRAESNRGISKW